VLDNLALGFEVALTAANLYYCFIGVFLGTFIGVLPGIGPFATIALLLPLTFHVQPTEALIMLAGIYYGAAYGGSTASILLNLPGTPSSAVTCLDGYPMSRQGRAGVALCITTFASFFGSMVGILLLAAFAPVLAGVALHFGAAEYFSLMLLGLLAAALIGQSSPLRASVMVILGLLLGMVGADANTGFYRFTFGFLELAEGFSLVAVAMGLFGVSEIIANAVRGIRGGLPTPKVDLRSLISTRADLRAIIAPMIRGAGLGSILGALPGTGGTIASFMSYAVEKKLARKPERFGQGAVEGLAAPEAANNSAAITAFIPTLTLGVPGDVVMALMLGAMIIHGVVPGPGLITQNPSLFWGLTVSFIIGNVMLLVLNLPLIGLWVRMLRIPYGILYPSILVFICIGTYSINNAPADVLMVLFFGLIGYVLLLLRFEPAPLLLGLVLGPLMEENLRRALLLSRGDILVFVERPLSAAFLAVAALLLAATAYSALRSRRARPHPVN
jgi:putative tricarboxylic transport membrane protein